jgi:hypothetical protein
MVLEGLEASESSTAGDDLVAKRRLVFVEVVVVVDLLVRLLGIAYVGINVWSKPDSRGTGLKTDTYPNRKAY